MKRSFIATVAAVLVAPTLASAQQPGPRRAPVQDQQVAQRCLDDLRAFRQQMRQDGTWLSGYRTGYGWPASGAASRRDQTAAHTAPGTGNADALSGSEARARAAGVQAEGGGAIGTAPNDRSGTGQAPAVEEGPFTGMNWRMPPMQEIRTLHAAAIVVAQRGEESGCQTVLSELKEAYGQYGNQLRQAGYGNDRMSGYRRQGLAAAKPVNEVNGVFRADNITGTDIRNQRDEYLGSVEDVVLDANSGRITYAIVAHGGFIGIGEDYVAVPWQRLRVTPNRDLFVLNTTEDALEKAPKVDLEAFADPQRYEQRRQETDRFWQQQDDARNR